ncbi:hypothetical protein D3C85_1065190 [compost metagenome]
MIDAYCGQGEQARFQFSQLTRVDIQLDMPAGYLMHAPGQGFQLIERLRATAHEVEAQGAHAVFVEHSQLAIADAGGQLRHADKLRPQCLECGQQVLLVEGLEGAGHHRPRTDTQRTCLRQVILDAERWGQITIVGDQRIPWVDNVAMGVEDRVRHAASVVVQPSSLM